MRSNSIKALPSGPKVLIQPQRGRYAQTVRAHATSRARMRKRLVAEATPVTSDVGADRPPAVPSIRASQVLREILTKNPKAKNFTVQQIVDAIGENQVATSLVFFSIPGMLPIPGTSNLSGIPAGLIAGQMIAGKIRNCRVLLRRNAVSPDAVERRMAQLSALAAQAEKAAAIHNRAR